MLVIALSLFTLGLTASLASQSWATKHQDWRGTRDYAPQPLSWS